jgi:hypothetical protein
MPSGAVVSALALRAACDDFDAHALAQKIRSRRGTDSTLAAALQRVHGESPNIEQHNGSCTLVYSVVPRSESVLVSSTDVSDVYCASEFGVDVQTVADETHGERVISVSFFVE